jgi:hypothetical protein
MQDRYVADIGDFGKYGLLKFLAGETGLKLGVNWYLVDPAELNEESRSDGKKTNYLYTKPEEYALCDKELHCQLKSIVDDNNRSVREVERRIILPQGTIFYAEKLSLKDTLGKEAKTLTRKTWVENGLRKLQTCEIVFFDPDNGFEVDSYKRHYNKGIKYIFYDEILEYFERGQHLIVYQHRDRKAKRKYETRFRELKKYFPYLNKIFGLRWKKDGSRDFVFILQNKGHNLLDALGLFLAKPWGIHNLFEKWEINL